MNDRIHILRQSVKVITQALTDSDIAVTQEGLQAYVQADPRTNKPIRVNLPYLPDNASDELVGAVQGFLDHEVAHVLFTDFTVNSNNPQLKNLINMLEDARVEKEMAKKYRGSGSNLEETGDFFLDQIVTPAVNKMIDEGAGDDQIAAQLMVPMLRALSGQEQYQHYLKDKMPMIQDIYDKLKPLAPEFEKLSSTKDVAKMANKVYKLLNEMDEDEDPDHDDHAEDEDESEAPGEGEDDGEGEGEGKGEGGGLSGEDEGESEEGGGSAGAGGADEDEGEGEGSGGKDEDEGKKGSGPQDSKWQPSDGEDSERLKGQAGAILDSLKDELNGFSESVSTKIAEDSAHVIKSSPYHIFTNEGDLIEKLPVPTRRYSDDMFDTLEKKTQAMVAPMQKDLERAIVARSKSVWEAGLRKGRMNNSSLARLAATGDDRVFRKKQESTTKDVAVSLVIDASGSMGGSKIHTAAAAAYALSSVLDRLKINHEVICFTTHMPSDGWNERKKRAAESEKKYGVKYSRNENLYMPVLKEYEERINTETKRRFGWLPHSGLLANNVDGECVEIAARRLMMRKEKGKIMMVLSDGNPSASGDYRALESHLKTVVKNVEKSGVNVIGIGIESGAVRDYYAKNIVINKVEELPSLVISRLKAMLLGN